MYEAVRVASQGPTTPARFASRAASLGYDGLVIHGPFDQKRGGVIRERFDIDIVRGIAIEAADRETAAGAITDAREEGEIVTVYPGDEDIQRFLARRTAVDVLVPTGEIEHTTAKVAGDHGIALAFDVGPVLRERGPTRVSALRDLRRLATIVDHFDVSHVVTANATLHLELRAPRELESLGAAIDGTAELVKDGLDQWGALAARARRNRDDRFIEPGVRRVDDETDAG